MSEQRAAAKVERREARQKKRDGARKAFVFKKKAKTHLEHGEWPRVPECPVCGKKRCRVSPDGTYAYCFRASDDGSAGALVKIGEDSPAAHRAIRAKPRKKAPAPELSDEESDRGYRAFLGQLSLSDMHRRALEARGISGDLVAMGYKSFDPRRDGKTRVAVDAAWAVLGGKVDTLPLVNKPEWSTAGLLIPVRDVMGLVVGLRVRPDVQKGAKYLWGKGAQARCHVATPADLEADVLWVTEGELKAEVAAQRLSARVVSLPGVSSGHDEAVQVSSYLGTREVVVAFDADFATNKQVAAARERLCQTLADAGLGVSVASWPAEQGKGLDDALVAGHQPQVEKWTPLSLTPSPQDPRGAKRSRPAMRTFLRKAIKEAPPEIAKAVKRARWCGECVTVRECTDCGKRLSKRQIAAENAFCPHCSQEHLKSLEYALSKSDAFLPATVAVGSCRFPGLETNPDAVRKYQAEVKAILRRTEKGFESRVRWVRAPGEILFYALAEDAPLIERALGRVLLLPRAAAARAIRLVLQKRHERILDYFDRDDVRGLLTDEWARSFVSTSSGKVAKKTLPWPSLVKLREVCRELRAAESGKPAEDVDQNVSECCGAKVKHVLERNGRKLAERPDHGYGIGDVERKVEAGDLVDSDGDP